MKKSLIALAVLAAASFGMSAASAGPPDFQPAAVVKTVQAVKQVDVASQTLTIEAAAPAMVTASATRPGVGNVRAVHAMAGCMQSPSMAYLPAVPPDPCRRA